MWISNYCFSCIFQHNNMKRKAKSVKYYIIRFTLNGTAFQSKIREGAYYIFSVCNKILYWKAAIQLKRQMYNTRQELFTKLYTHDSFPSWKLTNHPSPDDNFFRSRCTPLASLELTISVYTRSITTLDPKDPVLSKFLVYSAHRFHFI